MSTYNGWKNYETWVVNIWMSNDQGGWEYWQEQAQSAWDETKDEDEACRLLAENLKESLGAVPEGIEGMHADLLGSALRKVSWDDLAEHLISDVEKDNE